MRTDATSGSPRSIAVVGAGRMGTSLAGALAAAGIDVTGPLGRGPHALEHDAVLLCVPDAEITAAAAAVAPGPLLGHCSGALGLDVLGDREGFGLHPLTSITAGSPPDSFRGVGCAVAGTTGRALELAQALASDLQMLPFEVSGEDRGAYHAAASIAANFLVTLEAAAERLAAGAGVGREALVPLVRATVENWASLGPERALTGPVVRGDDQVVARQREAVAERAPDLIGLFDELVCATRALAAGAAVAA